MSSIEPRHVFGPVPSRRLGRSLGVDLVPFKVCTYDCVYCQLGRTTDKTVERREYVPTTAVLEEIEKKLEAGIDADFITLSGFGEPTRNRGCGEIIRGIKCLTRTPVAVLTNGSLLSDLPAIGGREHVRKERTDENRRLHANGGLARVSGGDRHQVQHGNRRLRRRRNAGHSP